MLRLVVYRYNNNLHFFCCAGIHCSFSIAWWLWCFFRWEASNFCVYFFRAIKKLYRISLCWVFFIFHILLHPRSSGISLPIGHFKFILYRSLVVHAWIYSIGEKKLKNKSALASLRILGFILATNVDRDWVFCLFNSPNNKHIHTLRSWWLFVVLELCQEARAQWEEKKREKSGASWIELKERWTQ